MIRRNCFDGGCGQGLGEYGVGMGKCGVVQPSMTRFCGLAGFPWKRRGILLLPLATQIGTKQCLQELEYKRQIKF